MNSAPLDPADFPVAETAPKTPLRQRCAVGAGVSRMWIATTACVVAAVGLTVASWRETGPRIRVTFAQGHGIEPGAAVRLRGIDVGRVESATTTSDLQHVVLALRISPEASAIATAETEFWIERPQLGIAGVHGLDTVVGAKYVAVDPGPIDRSTGAKRVDDFIGRESPPVDLEQNGGIEFSLESGARYGLQVGSPVVYRGVTIGTVVHVGLSSDAGSVESRIQIQSDYRALIRLNSVFWPVSGFDLRLGWTGVKFAADSLASVAAGGVSVATPTEPAAMAQGGQRYILQPEPVAGWPDWRPHLLLGPQVAEMRSPNNTRATFSAQRKRWGFTRLWQMSCWVHRLEDGRIVCPAELAQGEPIADDMTLELEGQALPLSANVLRLHGKLATIRGTKSIPAINNSGQSVWPNSRLRIPSGPEDCVLLLGSEGIPLASSRLLAGDVWPLDSNVALSGGWLGASVVARSDGALIGILVWNGKKPAVAPLTGDLESPQ